MSSPFWPQIQPNLLMYFSFANDVVDVLVSKAHGLPEVNMGLQWFICSQFILI